MDRHGSRLLVVRRRRAVREANAAGYSRSVEFLRGPPERKRIVRTVALVEELRLGEKDGPAATRLRKPMAHPLRSICCCYSPMAGPRIWSGRLASRRWSESTAFANGSFVRQPTKLYWHPGRELYADTPKKGSSRTIATLLQFSATSSPVTRGAPIDAEDRLRRAEARAVRLVLPLLSPPRFEESGIRGSVSGATREFGTTCERNLTTFAETADRPGRSSRSDCHAWSASPNIELFRTVLGMTLPRPASRRY